MVRKGRAGLGAGLRLTGQICGVSIPEKRVEEAALQRRVTLKSFDDLEGKGAHGPVWKEVAGIGLCLLAGPDSRTSES